MKMPNWATGENARKLLVIPPLVLGVAVFGWSVSRQKAPERRPVTEASRTLRVIAVPQVDVVPRVIGHGTAKPEQVWRAIAEVKGRVVHVHERLAPGAFLKAGEELLRVDATEYELAVAQLESDIQQANAQLAELEGRSANYDASLNIEKASLALAEKELARIKSLQQRNAAAGADVDAKEREVLAQRQSVQNLENSINLLPAEKNSLEATMAVKQASLKQAKIDLAKTTILAPFDCRLGDLSIEVGQFVAAGEKLFETLSTAAVEIDAKFSMYEARTLFSAATAAPLSAILSDEAIRERTSQMGVKIRLESGDVSAEWDGRVERLREELDTQTRTLGVVVAVDKPYEQVIPGRRPPLLRGMYCEVELKGQVREAHLVIPRSSLHDGHVYVLDAEKRLHRQSVEVDFAQANFVCLRSGLESGHTIVVSDPTPAIDGMLVDPVPDGELLQSLLREASGGGATE